MVTIATFSALAGLIHQAALDAGRWQDVLQGIAQAIHVSAGGVIMLKPDGSSRISAAIGTDATAQASYEQYYGAIDPVMPRALTMPEGPVLTRDMIISRSEIRRTEFYHDWLRPQNIDDCLIARVPGGSGSGLLAFAVPPTASGFDREAIRLVRLLVPHLQIAARTHLHVLNLTRQRSRILEALDLLNRPVLFVDATARVRLANRSAEHLLREADALSGGGCSGLEAATSGQTAALRHLIARAAGLAGEPATGGSLSLAGRSEAGCSEAGHSDGRPLIVNVIPMPDDNDALLPYQHAGVMLLVTTASRCVVSRAVLQSAFGLTPAEAKLAQLVEQGQGLKSAARAAGIAPSTARTHLLRIFAKTGTARQAELVHLLSRLERSDGMPSDEPPSW